MSKRTKKLSLADQLAALDNPAPTDFDPENAENFGGSEDDASGSSDVEEGDGREHYADVGKSRLRDVAAERPITAAYKGTKSSRKDIFENQDEPSENDMQPSDEDDIEESGSEGDMAAFEDFDREVGNGSASFDSEDDDEPLDSEADDSQTDSDSGSDRSDISQDESEEESEDDNSEDERQAAELKKMLADDQKAMVQEVARTAVADAEKGQAVKKQLSLYDSLLDARIKLQKGLQSTNLLCEESQLDAEAASLLEVQETALGLIETIFSLREDLMAQDKAALPPSRKRKYDDADTVNLADLWSDMQQMEDSFSSWRDHTLTKWSNKIQAASGVDKGKFKVLNQGILAQINESKSDREKLLKRTQLKRFKSTSKSAISTDDVSEDVYDDGDFYSEMLKDLIDSRMLDSTNSNQMKWVATKQPKQKKANVDTRASKGRKLRYHVHEKIQNFMAPIPMSTWHEEQIDELFGSLLGQSLRVDEDMTGEQDEPEDSKEVEVVEVGDDFKLFG